MGEQQPRYTFILYVNENRKQYYKLNVQNGVVCATQ